MKKSAILFYGSSFFMEFSEPTPCFYKTSIRGYYFLLQGVKGQTEVLFSPCQLIPLPTYSKDKCL